MKKLFLAALVTLSTLVSAHAETIKIAIDTQNEKLNNDIWSYMQDAIAQFPNLSIQQHGPDATMIITPRSSGNTFFFVIILNENGGMYVDSVTGVCTGEPAAMRAAFKQAVATMAKNGDFKQ
jgi:hypothetical protein